jgi:hypothetical protein
MALPEESADCVGWARRRNNRWIVHHGLGKKAERYLGHLQRTDPERLLISCRNARLLVQNSPPGEDPKPWFYSGIFSRATDAERTEYLSEHLFLSMTVAPDGDPGNSPPLEHVSQVTLDKIRNIRAAIARLPSS